MKRKKLYEEGLRYEFDPKLRNIEIKPRASFVYKMKFNFMKRKKLYEEGLRYEFDPKLRNIEIKPRASFVYKISAQILSVHFFLFRFIRGPFNFREFTKPRRQRRLQRKVALFQNFRFKRFLVFRSNLLPMRDSEVVPFNFTT